MPELVHGGISPPGELELTAAVSVCGSKNIRAYIYIYIYIYIYSGRRL